MKRAAVLFAIFIIGVIVLADMGRLPRFLSAVYGFRYGDKLGHFILFGLLNFFVVRAVLAAFPAHSPILTALSVGLALALFIAAEEYSQNFFSQRTPDIFDLLAGYLGMFIGGLVSFKRHAVG